ncbi:MAG: SH3 domain-containing protein, partial [Acidobacteria bacterium]|nr:SH3 domain-containing protein [Acidobacteriota bacterium]
MGILLLLGMLFAASDDATVGKPVVNMYSRAAEDADVVSQAIYGVNVGVLERSGGWVSIRTPDGYSGWVVAESLADGANHKRYAGSGRVAEVTSLFAHLYRDQDVTNHQPLLTVPFETRLEITAEPAGNLRWLRARLVNGREAWVQRGDLSFDAERMSIPDAIATARRFLGLPYTWGGTSSYGYDCSGFTQMLCRRRGVLLPRDAGPQSRWEGV